MTIWHLNVILFHFEYLGLRLNTRKCFVSKLSPAQVESICTMVGSLRLGQEISDHHAVVVQNKGSSPIKIHVYGKGMHQVLHALSIWRSPQFVTFGPSLGVFFPLSSQRMPHHGGSKQGVYPILNSMFMVRARAEHFMPFLYGGVSGL